MNRENIEHVPAEKWAYGLMGGFLSLMVIVALAVWLDAQNRSSLEKITEPTAVGDPIMLDFDPER